MKLLLHTCCAPCLIYPLERLRQEGYEVAGLFYNPNIHPPSEYKRRRDALVQIAGDGRGRPLLEIIVPQYKMEQYFRKVFLNSVGEGFKPSPTMP